ncbi:hypothetical protein ABKN59_008264 [Abortiporus biennis]
MSIYNKSRKTHRESQKDFSDVLEFEFRIRSCIYFFPVYYLLHMHLYITKVTLNQRTSKADFALRRISLDVFGKTARSSSYVVADILAIPSYQWQVVTAASATHRPMHTTNGTIPR